MKKQIVSFSIAFMYLLVSFSSTAVMACLQNVSCQEIDKHGHQQACSG